MANFKYRRMFLNPNTKLAISAEANATSIDQQLSTESTLNKAAAWNKLGKTNKMKILNDYVDRCCVKDHALSPEEAASLKQYFSQSLDDKMLQHVKDVQYDKVTGQLTLVPQLAFNPVTRKFTLRASLAANSNGGTVKKRPSSAVGPRRPPLQLVNLEESNHQTAETAEPPVLVVEAVSVVAAE
jgi:hypothetical protein